MIGNVSQIRLRRSSQCLELTWCSGDVSHIPSAELRRYCACAGCRARQVVGKLLINEATEIDTVKLMGAAGLQVIFTDGHDRGVFPWAYLRAIADGRAGELVCER